MRYNELTRDEVKMLLDSATFHGDCELIAYDLGWLSPDRVLLKAITRGYINETNEPYINVTTFNFEVCEEAKYSAYLGCKTRLKFLFSSGGNWPQTVDDYFDDDWDD
jgi:hypothetical protein